MQARFQEKKFVEHPLIREKKLEARLYQQLIFAKAIEKNTLVVAPTALGKTVIAILLAAYFLERHKDENKKVLVLAPTKPLAAQHERSFKEFMNFDESKISLLTGSVKKEKRKEIFESSKIICATPQTIANDIKEKLYSMNNIILCVFDEAHRAVGDYDYVFIASKLSSETRILALTASPGSEEKKIMQLCENLKIENIEVKTEKDSDVRAYVKPIEISWIKVKLPEEIKVVRNLMEKIYSSKLEEIKSLGITSRTLRTRKELLELRAAIERRLETKESDEDKSKLYRALSACTGALIISHAIELAETQSLEAFVSYLERIKEDAKKGKVKALKNIASSRDFERAFEIAKNALSKIEHPKLREIENILKNLRKGEKAIVFTQYRESAKKIIENLERLANIRAARFVGQATKTEDKGLTQKEQIEIIRKFKKGEYNILVATSVAEEGLDIPAVDYVIFYEPIPSEIRAIQRRGRTGRSKIGRVIILITEGTRDQAFYWSSFSKEKKMKETLGRLKRRFLKPELKTFFEKKEAWVGLKELENALPKEIARLGIILKPKKFNAISYVYKDVAFLVLRKSEDKLESFENIIEEAEREAKENRIKKLYIICEGDSSAFSYLKTEGREAIFSESRSETARKIANLINVL